MHNKRKFFRSQMASRRRKKNCCNHRPPLEFINSPDDQDLRVLSPESAADNPLTARSVLPNETTEWVSYRLYTFI